MHDSPTKRTRHAVAREADTEVLALVRICIRIRRVYDWPNLVNRVVSGSDGLRVSSGHTNGSPDLVNPIMPV